MVPPYHFALINSLSVLVALLTILIGLLLTFLAHSHHFVLFIWLLLLIRFPLETNPNHLALRILLLLAIFLRLFGSSR